MAPNRHPCQAPAATPWPRLAELHRLLDERDTLRSLWESAHARAVLALDEGADAERLRHLLGTAWRAFERSTQLDDDAQRMLSDRLAELGHAVDLVGSPAEPATGGGD